MPSAAWKKLAGRMGTTDLGDLLDLVTETQAAPGGGPHTHPESDVTSLVTDLAAKALSTHNHDASYAPTHSHPYEATGAVATHAGLADPHPGYLTPAEGNAAYAPTHAHPYAPTSHSHVDADIPAAITRDAEVTSAISTHAATPHGGSLPAGLIVMWGGLIADIPSGWLLCNGANGTPDLRSRFIKGAAGEAGATGGSATHGHTVTQAADHAALTHSGATVGNHVVTQPSAHADHTLSGAIATESAHTHAYTQIVNHLHVETLQGGTTGTTTGTHLMGSAATGGSIRNAGQSTANPTGGVASGTTAAGSAHTHGNGTLAVSAHGAHSGTAVDAHTVAQASQHAAQSHTGSAVDTVNSEPAYFALCFIQKT